MVKKRKGLLKLNGRNINNMPTQRIKIIKKTLEILENRPYGIRYSEFFCAG